MNILEEIAQKTKERIEAKKKELPLEVLKEKAQKMDANTGFPFEKALKKEGVSFICEVKKASPSKVIIAKDFPYVEIAKAYEKEGASAISVLTEPYYFQGADRFLEEIHQEVSIPLLRKDFTVDAYMIYEAKVIGASAVLLICALLDDQKLSEYLALAESLGLSALVEAHDEEEVKRAMQAKARVIGVNNRDLKTFTVDIHNSMRLRELVPEDILFVSESGIRTSEDIQALAAKQVDAVLVGETMMRASKDANALQSMIQAGKIKVR